MSNCYTTTCFKLTVTAAEAELLREAQKIGQALADDADPGTPSAALLAAFPDKPGDEPLTALRAIFDDPDYPYLEGDIITVANDTDPDKVVLTWGSIMDDPDTIARLFQACCPSALPFRFGYANTCDKSVPDSFSGGWTEVRADAIVWLTHRNADTGRRYVIEAPCEEAGKLYWNAEKGFGPLDEASVFSEDQRAGTALPTPFDTNWMMLPETA